MANEIALFEKNCIEQFKQLAQFKKMKNELEEKEDEIKRQLETSMKQYNVTSFKNDYITISYVDATTSETIDLAKFKEAEPELYGELLNDFKKVTSKKGYVRFLVK